MFVATSMEAEPSLRLFRHLVCSAATHKWISCQIQLVLRSSSMSRLIGAATLDAT